MEVIQISTFSVRGFCTIYLPERFGEGNPELSFVSF